MCPIWINGRQLGVARNGVFTAANTDPIPGGRLWPEAALTWNAMRLAALADGIPAAEFAPGGPASSARSYAQQVQQQAIWVARGQPQKAATPGTSNHGWGIAVDCPWPRAQAWLMRHAREWGWSHDEGARVGEPWHFRYVGATRAQLRKARRMLDPLRPLTRGERRKVMAYKDLLTKRNRRGGELRSARDRRRRKRLRAGLVRSRKAIWTAARRDGWDRHHRRERYALLLALTK